MVDRGHRHQLVDPVLADRLKEAVEVQRAGQDLHPAAELQRRDQLAVAAGHVEQRHRHQVDIDGPSERSVVQAAKGVLAVGQEVGVRGHRPLGKAGRAARVEDRREVVAREVLDDRRARPSGSAAAGREGVRRAGVLHHVGDLLLGQARVHRDHHRAQQLRAEEREHPVDAVGQTDRHAVAAADAVLAQAAGHARGAIPQLAVGDRLAAADLQHGRRAAVTLDARAQHVHQRRRPIDVARHAAPSRCTALSSNGLRPRGNGSTIEAPSRSLSTAAYLAGPRCSSCPGGRPVSLHLQRSLREPRRFHMPDKMTLYVCHIDDGGPSPHACRRPSEPCATPATTSTSRSLAKASPSACSPRVAGPS